MLLGEKRSLVEMDEAIEDGRKRVKMRDLQSVIRSEDVFCAESDALVTSSSSLLANHAPNVVHSKAKGCIAQNSLQDDKTSVDEIGQTSLLEKDVHVLENHPSSRGIGLDLNVGDVSSPVNEELFYPYQDLPRYRDMSECGSTIGSLEEKDSMRIWKEMKQNGFLSSSRGGIPLPNKRGRKSKNDALQKKMEAAKREQVDRFSKIAARSGLLNELNPGIINHVRNSKQVRSIIEALVGCEKPETGRAGRSRSGRVQSGSEEIIERQNTRTENINETGGSNIRFNASTLSRQKGGYSMIKSSRGNDEGVGTSMTEGMYCNRTEDINSNHETEEDILALKLSSSIVKSSHEGNSSNVSLLSVKAATVASQWLELIYQDVKGRLAALRHSKKKVQAVIQTEVPLLLSKEFSTRQESDLYVTKGSASVPATNVIASMHQARWSALFDQMAKALLEEENQLESWLHQVREMQIHCDKGLQHHLCSPSQWLHLLGTSQSTRREKSEREQRELAVRAAAASIYSTCSFLSTMDSPENVSGSLSH